MKSQTIMKQAVFSIIFLLVFFDTAIAQFDRGTWYIGANSTVTNLTESFYTTPDGVQADVRNFVVNLEPSVGIFIANRLLLSVKAEFSYADLRSSDDWRMTANAYSIGPAVSYHLGHGWFRPFVGLGTSFGNLYSEIRAASETTDEKFSLVDVYGQAGLGIFFTDRFAITGGFDLNHINFSEGRPSVNVVSVFVGVGFHL
jgi:hypothetical protein